MSRFPSSVALSPLAAVRAQAAESAIITSASGRIIGPGAAAS
jgi:hypothetical protein